MMRIIIAWGKDEEELNKVFPKVRGQNIKRIVWRN